jgi:hypothetical protein
MRSCWYGSQCDDGGVLGEDWGRARARSDLRVGKMIFLKIGLAWLKNAGFCNSSNTRMVTRDSVRRGGRLVSQLSLSLVQKSYLLRIVKYRSDFQDAKIWNQGLGVLV